MRNFGFILVLVVAIFVALFLGVVASISAAAELQLTTRDQSTGPYNPNQPRDDAVPRGA